MVALARIAILSALVLVTGVARAHQNSVTHAQIEAEGRALRAEFKIDALDLGADDYVTKPFGIGELVARIRTALRHRVQQQGGEPVYERGGLFVDLSRRLVRCDGTDVKLSPKEFEILRLLVTHAGKVLTHRMLMREIWGGGGDVQYLRIYVRQLRQKLERHPDRPERILTETGVGYRLA
jgi:two-component system KDP operon response regulator KdpE